MSWKLRHHWFSVDSDWGFPISLRERIILLAHEGHQGLVHTKQWLRELYWWLRMDDLVNMILSACATCQASDKSAKACPLPMQPVEFPKGPFQHVALDIVGPFERGTNYCTFSITLIDFFSTCPEVGLTSTVTTDTVEKFLTTIFARKGSPCIMTTVRSLFLLILLVSWENKE